MKTKNLVPIFIGILMGVFCPKANACTGITLTSADGTTIVARTIEWGGTNLNSMYVVVPRGHTTQSYTPSGVDGMMFTARHGYVGFAVEQQEFITEGLNERGLSAGLFYFPHYGEYVPYNPQNKHNTISDFQLVSYILGECATIEEVKEAVANIDIVNIDPRSSTVHWRFIDASGHQVVLEIVNRQAHFYDNPLGVFTNSPGFEWQLTNLNNYVNLYPGSAPAQNLHGMYLSPFSYSSGLLGLPGDFTAPSRFVRAAFFQSSAPQQPTAEGTVRQCFQILNCFDIPIGVEFGLDEVPVDDMLTATQWTTATDMQHRKIYFRTMYNPIIQCIDLNSINFRKAKYQATHFDSVKQQPIKELKIDN